MNKTIFNINEKRIWIAGSRGLVGSACVQRFSQENCNLINDPDRHTMDLRSINAVHKFVEEQRPEIIILSAAKVGGILDNVENSQAFYNDNIAIQNNVIESAAYYDVEKLVFLGSSCIYPRDCPQPIREEYLETGTLEKTNESYARAKIEGIKLVQKKWDEGHDFISLMPCNLYGSNDHFNKGKRAHVIPALINKFYNAKRSVKIWGTGSPLREFLHVDDLADAIVFCLKNYSDRVPLNIGSGEEVFISTLVKTIADIANFEGDIIYDSSKPDGTPRKILDSSRLYDMGWHPRINLSEGLQKVWMDYVSNQAQPADYQHD